MNKMLKILSVILLTNVNVYASNIHNYNNNIINNNKEEINYLDRIPELNSNITITYLDLRDIMKNASFSIGESKTTSKNTVVDYEKILLFIDIQHKLSKLNFQLNKGLLCNDIGNVEDSLIFMMRDIKEKIKKAKKWELKYSDSQYEIVKQCASEPYCIPCSLYCDVSEIMKNKEVVEYNDQLKIDICTQIKNMKKYLTQHDEEFKVLHMYFINQFYKKSKQGLAYARNNDGKEKLVVKTVNIMPGTVPIIQLQKEKTYDLKTFFPNAPKTPISEDIQDRKIKNKNAIPA